MRIHGDLASYELSDLLQWLAQGRKSGRLTVRRGDGEERSIWFQGGRIALSSSSDPDQRLDSYLLRQGLIDADTAERAQRLQEATQMLPGQILVTLGAISEEELARVMRLKTEESVCQLLTTSDGEFTFTGEALPSSSMVPLQIEVANLLLRSMERLDSERGARECDEIETSPAAKREGASPNRPAPVACEPGASESSSQLASSAVAGADPVRRGHQMAGPDAGGRALAEVIDPEVTASRRGDESSLAGATGTVALSAPRALWRRLLPAAVAAVLVIFLSVTYLLLRPGEPAAATGFEGAVRFTVTEPWQPPAEAAGPDASAPRAETAATAAGDKREARLRGDYENRLALLREELREAQRTAAERQKALEALRSVEDQAPATAGEGGGAPAPSGTLAAAAKAFAAATPGAEAAPRSRSPSSQAGPPQGPAGEAGLPSADGARAAGLADPQRPAASPAAEQRSAVQPAAAGPSPAPAAESVFVPPRVVRRARAAYPAAARRMGREVTVTVRVLVDESGTAKELQPGPEAGFGFDQAALAAARRTRWQPATRDGEPVESWIEMRFVFTP